MDKYQERGQARQRNLKTRTKRERKTSRNDDGSSKYNVLSLFYSKVKMIKKANKVRKGGKYESTG